MTFKHKKYLFIERLLARKTDKIVCNSETEIKVALDYKIVKENKLASITKGSPI